MCEYYEIIKASKKGTFLSLKDFFSPLFVRCVWLSITIEFTDKYIDNNDFSGRIYAIIDGTYLSHNESYNMARNGVISPQYLWATQTTKISSKSFISSIIQIEVEHFKGIIQRIIFSATSNGEKVPIKRFMILYESSCVVSEPEEMLIFEEISRGMTPQIGLYEWKIDDPNGSTDWERMANIYLLFEFWEPIDGEITCHFQFLSYAVTHRMTLNLY
jgi:hypothetical protein